MPHSIVNKSINYFIIKHNNETNNRKPSSQSNSEYTLYCPEIFLCENDFDSKKDALIRKYLYKIKIMKNGNKYEHLFTKDFYYNIDESSPHTNLDIDKIYEITYVFINDYYNFSNFCKIKEGEYINPLRKINDIKVYVNNDLIFNNQEINLIFIAKSFMRNQIRIIVNFILDYACGKISKEEIIEYLNMTKINKNKVSVPAEGLYLHDIIYDKDVFRNHKENSHKYEKEYKDYLKLKFNKNV